MKETMSRGINPEQTDILLTQWAAAFNARQTRRVRVAPLGAPSGPRADAVRRQLRALVQRRPQVMVRISGGGRGMRAIRAHLDYISRHGQLALTDQDGERHLGSAELQWLAYDWQAGGIPIAERSARREALNIVLSMPAGTEPAAVLLAARDFAHAEFSGHQYALVLHRHEDDPGRAPSRHPHVHLCVKISGEDGRRLNPRKADLRRWRADFAERLREHGIDAAASGRLERFERQPRWRQGGHHRRQREAWPAAPTVQSVSPAAAPTHEQVMLQRYGELARILAASSEGTDRALALSLTQLCAGAFGRERDVERER